MQRRTVALIALVMVAAGCGFPPPPFLDESNPKPTQVTVFDDVLMAKLPDIRPLKQVKRQPVAGDITFAAPLNRLHGAWRIYLGQLNDGRLSTHPTAIKAVELHEGQAFADVCDPGPNHRAPNEVIQPMYCADRDVGDETPALMVLPYGFTAKVQTFADSNGERPAWVLTSVLAGMMYAVHLRHEAGIAGVTWPVGDAFDYCAVGIGMRAIFPAKLDELAGSKATAILAMYDQLVVATTNDDQRLGNLTAGYKTGRLEACVA